jgi:hypothetical protein
MKRHWQVHRRSVQRPDARQRWDRAYQSVLRWTLESELLASNPSANGKEEYHHAGSSLRPGLDLKAGQAPDD